MTKTTTMTIAVGADSDADDCLAAAAELYIDTHPEVDGWDLRPRWADDDERDMIELTVPVTRYTLSYASGRAPVTGTWAEIEVAILRDWPNAVYDHAGDMLEGGERTIVWACEEVSVHDDGARAVADIRRA